MLREKIKESTIAVYGEMATEARCGTAGECRNPLKNSSIEDRRVLKISYQLCPGMSIGIISRDTDADEDVPAGSPSAV